MPRKILDKIRDVLKKGEKKTLREKVMKYGLESKIKSLSKTFPIASILIGLSPFGIGGEKGSEGTSSRPRRRGL